MNQAVDKKLTRLLALLSFGLSALFIVLARLYTVSCSDIVVMYTAWPEVLEILVNVVECVIFGIAYAVFIYAAYRSPARGLRPCILIYFGSILLKYIGNYLVTWMTDTGMSTDYLLENLTYILIYAAIEMTQAVLVLLVVWRTMKSYHTFIARQQRIAANLPDATVDARTYAFPFTKLISAKNPLQKCALWSGAMISAFKIVSRIIFDISYGAPTGIADALWMLLYYLIDIFAGFAICLLITYLLMSFDSREQKAKA